MEAKKMLKAKAENMRAAKKAHQQETCEECGGDGSGRDDGAGPSTSRVGDTPESEDDGPHQSSLPVCPQAGIPCRPVH